MERKRDLASLGEILEEIEKRAAAYTPEWHMDLENPDIGTALAQVYGRLQNSTERKYRGLPEKFRIDFFNCLNTSMKASVPARGYAVFGLADSAAEGTGLPAGTALKTDAEDEYGEKIPVETEEDLFVIPDTLETIFESSDGDDYIGLYYDRTMEEAGGTRGGFPLFRGKAPNLQEHVFYLGHPWILSVTTRGRIHLDFYERKGGGSGPGDPQGPGRSGKGRIFLFFREPGDPIFSCSFGGDRTGPYKDCGYASMGGNGERRRDIVLAGLPDP